MRQASGVDRRSISKTGVHDGQGPGDRRVLTETQLTGAGVHCDADTRQPLEDAGVVTRVGNEELSSPSRSERSSGGSRSRRDRTSASFARCPLPGSVRRHAVRPVGRRPRPVLRRAPTSRVEHHVARCDVMSSNPMPPRFVLR